jgi:hypothetical protein
MPESFEAQIQLTVTLILIVKVAASCMRADAFRIYILLSSSSLARL